MQPAGRLCDSPCSRTVQAVAGGPNPEEAGVQDDIHYYAERMAEEERRARAAPYPEAAEVHQQIATLYRAQLALLTRRQQPCPA